MVFVFDLDDTICDTDSYSEKYISEFIKKNNLPYKQIATDVRFAESKFNWNTDQALKWYKQYGDQMMAEFPCKENVTQFLQHIHEEGHKIVIATARAKDWHTNPDEVTLKWLADNNIPYDKIYIGRIDKEKICEEVNADYFIDDDLSVVGRVANYFAKIGGDKQAFLATTNYNRELSVPDGVIRVKDFNDLKNILEVNLNESNNSFVELDDNYTSRQKRKIVRDDYDAIANVYANAYGNIEQYKEVLENFVKNLKGTTVLDVGCGAGQMTSYFASQGLNAVGLDFSKELLKIAQKNYPNIEFINIDICEFETNIQFDGIFTKDFLFHLPDEDLKNVLQKFKNMLKPEGRLCIILDMPKEEGEHIFIEELDERYKIYYNYLSPEKVGLLLTETGFVIDGININKDNDNASSYASGLMIFEASVSAE